MKLSEFIEQTKGLPDDLELMMPSNDGFQSIDVIYGAATTVGLNVLVCLNEDRHDSIVDTFYHPDNQPLPNQLNNQK